MEHKSLFIKNSYRKTERLKNLPMIANFRHDFSPSTNGIVYHNVFHYSNGKLEIFRFVPSATLVLPCKLLRDYTILIPEQDIETYINLLVKPHFDGFLVNRGDKFLDIKNLPKSKIGNSSI